MSGGCGNSRYGDLCADGVYEQYDDNDNDDDNSPQRIFWLDGMAGTGNSTIVCTIARRCSGAGQLGASLCFSRGGGELETARAFVTSIPMQLARRNSVLRTAICNVVRAQPDIADKMLGDQWRQLVLSPCRQFRAAEARPAPLVIGRRAGRVQGGGGGRVCAGAAH